MADYSLDRTLEDLIETVKVIARYFDADEVFIIGSQSILLSWPDAPVMMRTSSEIDAYAGNAKLWEITQKQLDPDDDPEASEEIAALYGEGSAFHKQHGFYIDGVDEHTATLPRQWQLRLEGLKIESVAKRLKTSMPTVSTWSGRFETHGLDGLTDKVGRGRKPSIPQKKIERVVAEVTRPPKNRKRWSVRSMGATPVYRTAPCSVFGRRTD
ncbi:helix-turn-helix domain-containing protein [Bradyrhizobium sp. CNPSo 4026]|nr:helix-turn-helix domain-containing protein [Bradyrhizobium cenepequi]